MRTHLFFLTLLLPFMAVAAEKGTVPLPKDYEPPAISLQQAVKKAEQCLADKKIKPEGYLQSAVFSPARQANQMGGDHGRHWIMTWQRSGMVLGGGVSPIIYEDGTCVVTYGE